MGFGAVNEKKELLTWCYFGLAVVAFVLGVVSIVVASYLGHAIYMLSKTEERALLAFKTHKLQSVFTTLYALSLIAWLLHFCISASIKYPCQEYWCVGSGCAALLIIIFTWARVACISADYEQVTIQTFTPESSPEKYSSPSKSSEPGELSHLTDSRFNPSP